MIESTKHIDSRVVHMMGFQSVPDVNRDGGSLIGSPTMSNGQITINGTTDAVNIDKWLPLLHNSTANTILAEVNFTDVTATAEIISFGDTSADTRIQFDNLGGGILRALVGVGGVTQWAVDTDAAVLVNGTTHKVALVMDGTEAVLYVDGTAPAQTFSTSTDKTVWFGTASMSVIDNGRIGCGNWNGSGDTVFMGGTVENVYVYNTALIAEEVSALNSNLLYVSPSLNDCILYCSSRQGVIRDVMAVQTLSNNNAAIIKEGMRYVTDYNGTTSQIDCGDIEMDGWTEMTISVWFRDMNTSMGDRRIVSKDQLGIAGAWILWIDVPNIKFQYHNGTAWQIAATAYTQDSKWHNIVAGFNPSSTYMYLDTTLINSTVTSGSLDDSDDENVVIGSDSDVVAPSVLFAGPEDDCKIYNRTWTSEERAREYAANKTHFGL